MQTVTVLLYAIWAAFSGLRIYAISNHNRLVTLAVVLLALVPVATNIIIFAFYESTAFSLIIAFIDPLTAILISRFYFALDDLQAQEMMTTLPSARHTTLRFAVSARTDDTRSGSSYDDDDDIYDTPTKDGIPPPVPPKDVYY
ncbi:hypothetical protein TRAPUB_4609 [Trametes pubescens]|uniref:Uncharacterized protein n=1 Tax=Trametes pubescens TaxID=154538 RepID=A0A1M2W784_TRAPU|nr:hypothetical protein TRAPUB_4609 [Trametes pubescens]